MHVRRFFALFAFVARGFLMFYICFFLFAVILVAGCVFSRFVLFRQISTNAGVAGQREIGSAFQHHHQAAAQLGSAGEYPPLCFLFYPGPDASKRP